MNQRRFFRSLMSLTLAAWLGFGPVLTSPAWAVGEACRGEHRDHNQVKHFCEAAEAQETAAEGQQSIAIIQAAVAAVCLAACTTSWLGATEAGCTYASISGAVAGFLIGLEKQEAWTNNLSSLAGAGLMTFGAQNAFSFMSMAQVGEKGINAAMSQVHGPLTEEATKEASKSAQEQAMKDKGMSCAVAALSAGVAVATQLGKGNSEDAAKTNYEAADALASQLKNLSLAKANGPVMAGVRFEAPGQIGNVFSGSAVVTPSQAPGQINAATALAAPPSLCLKGAKGFDATLSCALASEGNNLPPIARNPDFKKMVEGLSGMSADQLASLKDPKQITQATMGKLLTAEGQGRLAGILDQLKQDLIRESGVMRSALASNGSGSQGSSFQFPTDSSFGAPSQAGSENVQFDPNAKRGIASSLNDEENPAISLFTRVSKRYSLSREKVTAMRYQSAENRMLGGGR